MAIVFEGRDTAGKGATIKKIVEHLDPKFFKVVALGVPTKKEEKYWFERYPDFIKKDRITIYDRSWYSRAIVEPVMGYVTD